MKKVLLIGVGFLGEKLLPLFQKNGFEVKGTSIDGKNFLKLDIVDKISVEKVFQNFLPNIVILTASLTNVDYCEEHPAEAQKVNVDGVENVAEACKKFNSKLVFYSTDFVFDGEKENGNYSENDKVNPLSVYGKTKLEAEKRIGEIFPEKNFLILRTSTLYGFGKNFDKKPFTDWVVESLKAGKSINVVSDQITCPTLTDDLANATLRLVRKNKNGLYNVVGSEAISRFGFAKKIAKVFELDSELILEIDSSKLLQKAKRPKNSSLNISKIEIEGIGMSNVEKGLIEMKLQKFA